MKINNIIHKTYFKQLILKDTKDGISLKMYILKFLTEHVEKMIFVTVHPKSS